MKKRYTHLFFDLDNTLWDFEQNSQMAMRKTLSHFNLKEKGIGFESFYDSYSTHNKQLWSEYREGKVIKKELKRLRFEQTFKELGITGIDPLEMNLFYLTEMPFQTNLVEGAREVLDYIILRGYSLYIITNGFREVQLKKLEMSGLQKYFTKVYISEDIKAPKPSQKIFEHAIKSSNAKKETSLMIGDDYQTDIIGALRFGIDAAWLDSAYSIQTISSQVNNYSNKVYALREIVDLEQIL
ncbi:YjjG family noncanonical pyrimidine nucleotidase [Mariniphaga sp.]|uniref:YjjG family noncanonical pyrimidine nucleotidase n=1 Tax=Mariniphaga sp. TaxID=1954475 RepID=UPI003564D975